MKVTWKIMDIYNYSLLCENPSNKHISADIIFPKQLFNKKFQKIIKKLFKIFCSFRCSDRGSCSCST